MTMQLRALIGCARGLAFVEVATYDSHGDAVLTVRRLGEPVLALRMTPDEAEFLGQCITTAGDDARANGDMPDDEEET